METPSKAADRWPQIIGKYLWSRWLFTAVAAYMIFSVLLYAATDTDICIPCLWTTIVGVHCPGCGLTTASIQIVKLDFTGAWDANPLAFLILPGGIFFIYQDVRRFLKQRAAVTAAIA